MDIIGKSESKFDFKNIDNHKNVDNKNINPVPFINNDNIHNNVNNNTIGYNNECNYSDFELNNLTYNEALLLDKRNFTQYYLSLIKRNNIFIFAFIEKNDYNPIILKISIFFLSFSFFYFNSSLNITESTIHKIYIDQGAFNLTYKMPTIIYTVFSVSLMTFAFKMSFLIDKDISEIKRVKETSQLNGEIMRITKYIKKRTIIFFIIVLIYTFICWLMVGLTSAVYQNTQINLFGETMIGFVLYLVYPFAFSLLPALFRNMALKSQQNNCIYNFSKIIQYV